jgi:hypothetical protein
MKKKPKKKISLKQIKEIRKKKPLVCKDCKLYNAKQGICTVVVLDKGEKFELMTKPNDPCMWERMGVPVHRIRAWSDGENGYVEWTEDPKKLEE